MTPKEDQQPMTTREELTPGTTYQSVGGPVEYVGLDNYHGETTYKFREPSNPRPRYVRPNALGSYLASRQEVSVTVEELALELMNARRRMTGLEELSAERVKKIGLWPLKEETMCAASALLAEYVITKRTTEG